jgi:hypothetical protein
MKHFSVTKNPTPRMAKLRMTVQVVGMTLKLACLTPGKFIYAD